VWHSGFKTIPVPRITTSREYKDPGINRSTGPYADPHTAFDIFSAAGAVAQLYDISCLYHSSPTLFRTIQEPLYEAWVNLTSEITVQHLTTIIPALVSPEVIQSDHYFIPNAAGNGISPVWDFRTNQKFQGQENAFFVGKGVGSVVPPVDPPNNINWLRVGKVAGDIADEVYRIDTIGGQPPTSVSPPLPPGLERVDR